MPQRRSSRAERARIARAGSAAQSLSRRAAGNARQPRKPAKRPAVARHGDRAARRGERERERERERSDSMPVLHTRMSATSPMRATSPPATRIARITRITRTTRIASSAENHENGRGVAPRPDSPPTLDMRREPNRRLPGASPLERFAAAARGGEPVSAAHCTAASHARVAAKTVHPWKCGRAKPWARSVQDAGYRDGHTRLCASNRPFAESCSTCRRQAGAASVAHETGRAGCERRGPIATRTSARHD
ncbi:Uncharacterised protein [Burkholderia pseudomallei]|nr:Uncharacterised protein [Burkholderia pseudomallei]CAJ3942059.1 Uncharacterised protein [Burkholderia pseudomallei]CAJ4580734.1 Uncharacterised protein [Burkholderia pseudomallei]CAJ4635591.1 Uncharacterised protein [Burkholderia pseudomallei]CAJ4651236.1 Uncharacterised protein [Burkholderia pseudomallei]